MDVNGFCLHVREAVIQDLKNANVNLEQNHYNQSEVSLSSLQITFKNYESWAAFSDPSSAFVTFLKEVCPPGETGHIKVDSAKAENDDDTWFDLHKLKLLGVLWCDGKPNEKISELYHVLQDNNQP